MLKITGIRFKRAGKVYYFDPGDLELSVGQKAIVETVRGVEMGDVVISSKMVDEGSVVQPLKRIIRIATPEDLKHTEENAAKEPKAIEICHEKIKMHNLPMKLVGAEYTFDNSKVIFYFTAEGRVDFRELVKDLASVFKMRIELRQIGVRDEAKLVGGLGPCGLQMCCTTWLGDFNPVSIKMAKEQNLSLNPAKISGICGRLMCCLKYESGMYDDAPAADSAETDAPYPMRAAVPPCGAEKCIACEKGGIDASSLLEEDEGALDEIGLPGLAAGPSLPDEVADMAEDMGIGTETVPEDMPQPKGRTPEAQRGAAPSKSGFEGQGGRASSQQARGDADRRGRDRGPRHPKPFWDDSRGKARNQAPSQQGGALARERRPNQPEFEAREKPNPHSVEQHRPAAETRDASQQGTASGGINQGQAPERPQGFNKSRRRRHGRRRPEGAPEPGGPPKGE